MKSTQSYTSLPLTQPSLAPTPSSSVKSARNGRLVSMTNGVTSPPVELLGTTHGHMPPVSWFSTASTAEPVLGLLSHAIHD